MPKDLFDDEPQDDLFGRASQTDDLFPNFNPPKRQKEKENEKDKESRPAEGQGNP